MDKKIINHNGKLAKKLVLGKKLFDHQSPLLRKGDTVKLLTLPLKMFLGLTEP